MDDAAEIGGGVNVKAGDILVFRGCSWCEPQWEFDAPVILYEPVHRYGFSGGVGGGAIVSLLEHVCEDLCLGEDVNPDWHKGDIKEFEWRGWSSSGFARRKNAIHEEIKVRFFNESDGLGYEIVEGFTIQPVTYKRIDAIFSRGGERTRGRVA